jgi:hypothetical protein
LGVLVAGRRFCELIFWVVGVHLVFWVEKILIGF